MALREQNHGFWGLVQQNGPWKTTANDIKNSVTSKGYQGQRDQINRPLANGTFYNGPSESFGKSLNYLPRAPGPSRYVSNSIISNPLTKAIDPISSRMRMLEQSLLKTFGLDQQTALYPASGNFSRSNDVLNAYPIKNEETQHQYYDSVSNSNSTMDYLSTGLSPVSAPSQDIMHTDEVDFVMSPSGDTNEIVPIPVFNGHESYGDYPNYAVKEEEEIVTPQPGLAPEHRPQPVATHRPQPGLAPEHRPNQIKRKPPVKVHKSNGKPHKKRKNSVSDMTTASSLGKHKLKGSLPKSNKYARVGDTMSTTHAGVKRKGDSLSSTSKRVRKPSMSTSTLGKKRRATPASNPKYKERKRDPTTEKHAGKKHDLQDKPVPPSKSVKRHHKPTITTTGLPKSKQNHTKPFGVVAEGKSASKFSSNIPERKTRSK